MFIVFEGLDGSGKSTQIALLSENLKRAGYKVHVTAEPTDSVLGGLIRGALAGRQEHTQAELAGLFLADRIAHNKELSKFLDEDAVVICDRYYYSTFAYQGLELDMQWLMDANLNCPAIRRPDLCVFLDVNPSKCKDRIDSRHRNLEIFERDTQVMRRIRDRFFEVIETLRTRENVRVVNADREAGEVAAEILHILAI